MKIALFYIFFAMAGLVATAQSSLTCLQVPQQNPGLWQIKLIIPSDELVAEDWEFHNSAQNPINYHTSDSFKYSYNWQQDYIELAIDALSEAQARNMADYLYSNIYNNEVVAVANFNYCPQAIDSKLNTDYMVWQWEVPEKYFSDSFNTHYSKSVVDTFFQRNKVYVFFDGIEAKDLAVYHVLCKIIAQRNSTFYNKMVASGLSLQAGFKYHPARCGHFLYFEVEPNPFGVKEAVEAFFEELYAMPLFNYTSKEQLDLAKEQILADMAYTTDRFATEADLKYALQANQWPADTAVYLDSVYAVTKVDIMNFIRTYLHEKPFLLYVMTDKMAYAQLSKSIINSGKLEQYKVSYRDKRAYKLDEDNVRELVNVAYILNMTNWAVVDVNLYGVARKRIKQKRLREIQAYFRAKGVSNELHFHYKGNYLKNANEAVTFSIGANED